MKALTNILTRLLMLLLLMLVACTEDVAEVDDLVRGEEYVQVRMQVPGMKTAATRADEAEDNLTSVVVLVFRNDALVSKTEVTTASSTLTTTNTTGTFNIPRPKSDDVIHFLGNLPETVKNGLPATGGTQEEVLRDLTTTDRENLSYWGKATYNGGDITVTLYRNMAKIEIAAGDECTFPEDQLFIVGLVNANQVGALVPCNEEGTFGYRDEPTLPESPSPKTDEDAQPLVTSLYVFEHDNPGTANGLYVICKIEDDYYKVALIDEDKEPYPIIRNHRYVIYVNDLDYGADSFDIAARPETKPCNFEVRDFNESIKAEADKTQLYYDSNDAQVVTVDVTVPNGVSAITIGGAENFTIANTAGDGTLNGTTYTMGSGRTATFTFTLNQQDVTAEQVITFSGGESVNATSVTITMAQTPVVTFSPDESSKTMSVNDTYTITMTVPNNGTLTALSIAAEGFTVTASSGTLSGPSENVYSYTGGTTTFTFTATSAGDRTIRFYNGAGVNINVPTKEISVTVEEASGEEPGGGGSGEVTVWTGPSSQTNNFTLGDVYQGLSNYIKLGNEIIVYFNLCYYGQGETDEVTISVDYGWNSNNTLKSETYSGTSEKSISLTLTDEVLTKIENSAKKIILKSNSKNFELTRIIVIGTPISSN